MTPTTFPRPARTLALATLAGLVLSIGAATPSLAAGTACGLRGSVVDNGSDLFVKRDRQKVYNSCTVSFSVKAQYDVYIAGGYRGTGWTSCKSVGAGKTVNFDFEFNEFLINGTRAKGVWTTC